MALTVQKNAYGNVYGEPGYKTQMGVLAFTTTALTGELPVAMTTVHGAFFTPIGSPGAQQLAMAVGSGTVGATAVMSVRAAKAGSITAASLSVDTTVAAHGTDYWTVGIINKGAAGAGTAVVVNSATDANSTKTTTGSAFTADVPRALTLTGTAADLVVAEGDLLEITLTDASGSAADLVGLNVQIRQSTPGTDEQVYLDESTLFSTNGQMTVPSTGTITVARTGANPASGAKYNYLIYGQ